MSSMDRRVAWVGTVLLLCFALLFVQMNNIQVRQASALDANPLNKQVIPTESPFFEARGSILSADGSVLAYSVRRNDEYHWLRVYPAKTSNMFADITGYYANAVAADPLGVEASYNAYLEQHQSPGGSLGALLDQHTETDNVYLTVSVKVQEAAVAAFKASPVHTVGGAVVAIDPRTGAILAMYGNPTYNPNLLASHNAAYVNKIAAEFTSKPCQPSSANVTANSLSPLCNFALDETQAPGSTMKVVTTSAIYDHDPRIEKQFFPGVSTYKFPNSFPVDTLQNYGGGECPAGGGYLPQILEYSCDTAYAQIGDELGYARLATEAHSFGFGQVPPIDIPGAQPAVFSPANAVGNSTAYEGYSAIGQYDDRATVLQMALVAAAIANDGVIMAPHVVSRAVNTYGETEFTYHPHAWLRATSPETAQAVRQLMTGVTRTPGATAAGLFASWYANGGPVIAAKTGTAEPTSNTCGTDNWLIALGPAAPGQVPTVAVAAMIPVSQAECSSGYFQPTGASIAGPVLLPVLQAALAEQGSS